MTPKDGEPFCVCGCKAWFASKVTLPEWIGFKVGFHKDEDVKLLYEVDTKLGSSKNQYVEAQKNE